MEVMYGKRRGRGEGMEDKEVEERGIGREEMSWEEMEGKVMAEKENGRGRKGS